MIIVSNASPLINLARIGKLDLLHDLYSELIIPEAVWHEVVVEGIGQPGADEMKTALWVKTQVVTNRQLVQSLRQELDAGEAEAIALALEIGAELLLMDEHLGRDVARYFGLRYTGLIGVLIEAKHKGFIRIVKPYLDSLRDIAGFRVGEALYLHVLQDEGEI
jgi:predicted nucleic acid-binding protein